MDGHTNLRLVSSVSLAWSEQTGMATDDLTAVSDAALVVAIGRWRQDALAEAYRRHGGAVFGLARRVVANEETAKDIVQEIFLRLWNQPERYDPARGALRSYLLAQTHGRAVDVIRSETARRRREERDARSAADIIDNVQRQVEDLALGDEVRDAIAGLPEGERRAITLAYLAGHTYREVARLLDEPEGTIKSRIRSGLRRLRGPLTEAGLLGT
jgi:RNA polymerase sigma-70 factor, ECF subfamily